MGNSSSTSMNVIGSMIPVYTSRILRSTLLAACSDDISAAADDDDEEDDGHNDHNDQGPGAAASNDDYDENDRDSFVARETCVASVAASSRMTSPCSGRRLLALHHPKHARTVLMNPPKRGHSSSECPCTDREPCARCGMHGPNAAWQGFNIQYSSCMCLGRSSVQPCNLY